jgi:hypothetical protein
LHDTGIDENKVGIVDNSLRNRGKNHQEAIIMSATSDCREQGRKTHKTGRMMARKMIEKKT